jgi:hypothetical protein
MNKTTMRRQWSSFGHPMTVSSQMYWLWFDHGMKATTISTHFTEDDDASTIASWKTFEHTRTMHNTFFIPFTNHQRSCIKLMTTLRTTKASLMRMLWNGMTTGAPNTRNYATLPVSFAAPPSCLPPKRYNIQDKYYGIIKPLLPLIQCTHGV